MKNSKYSAYYDITLRLNDIQDLFHAPQLDPFASQVTLLSGIDQIISYLKPKSLNRKVRTTLLLSPNQISANTQSVLLQAIQNYCQARMQQINSDLVSIRWQGSKALQIGMLFLAVCLLLSTLFDGLDVLPRFLRQFLSEGFLIAGWVGLWHPIDLLLFEWWSQRRYQQLYERLKQMELIIAAQD